MVVQLSRLRELSLLFHDPSIVARILAHIGYSEHTVLVLYAPVYGNAEPSEAMSRVLPLRNVKTIQHVRKSTVLTIYPDDHPRFSTNKLLVHFQEPYMDMRPQKNPQGLARFVSNIVEVVGGDTIVSLNIESWQIDLTEGMWEALLHGLPQLERMRYHRMCGERDLGLVNSFILGFSRPFEGKPVCPQLQNLEMPRGC